MTSYIVPALAGLAFFLLSLRPAGVDDRTARQMLRLAARVGLVRLALASVRVVLVTCLLVLVDVCRMAVNTFTAVAGVLVAMAYGAEGLAGRARLTTH
ncbi:hypothetical protein ABZ912_42480 [Nonomuraea angiospora]|uniref:hypothetical protein n=1 Tax=Nonomuraea angiospora TaxID=46172 RepID=UPI0033F7F1FC